MESKQEMYETFEFIAGQMAADKAEELEDLLETRKALRKIADSYQSTQEVIDRLASVAMNIRECRKELKGIEAEWTYYGRKARGEEAA